MSAPKYSIHLYIILSIFIVASWPLWVLSQDHTQLELDMPLSGALISDSYQFYSLTLPDNLVPEKYNLILKIEQTQGDSSDFSDADLFISKDNQFPRSASNSTWYSESFGDDIITIGKKYTKSNEIFYIGVYCQFRCSYTLKAQLNEINSIFAGKVRSVVIPKESSVNFNFTPDKDFDNLNFSFITPKLQQFKVYISDKNPSTQNTFELQPSWMGGYSLDITKQSKEYQTSGDYKIWIQALDHEVTVYISISYHQTEYVLSENGAIIYDAWKEKVGHCFAFPINASKSNENIILIVMIFSGSLIVQHNGWTDSQKHMKFDNIPYNEYTDKIYGEKVTVITSEEIKAFKNNQKNQPGYTPESYSFCVFGKENSSFTLQMHYSSKIESWQNNNILIMGQSIKAFLPKGQVTKYRWLDFTWDSNITWNFDNIEGEAEFFGLFVEDQKNSYYTEKVLNEQLKLSNTLLTPNSTFYGSELIIPNQDNKCHQKITPGSNISLDEQLKTLNCAWFCIIHCKNDKDSDTNCIYRLRSNNEKNMQQLPPKTSLYNILTKSDTDIFQVVIDDDNVEKITIVLNSISGITDLTVYQYLSQDKKVLSLIEYSLNNKLFPNVIVITKKSIKQDTLRGVYRLEVLATTFSTYSIYYYTDTSMKDVSMMLNLGEIMMDFFEENEKYKIYAYEKEVDSTTLSDLRITLTQRSFSNYEIEMYVFKNLDDFVHDDTKYNNGEESVSGHIWSSKYNNEIIISKHDSKNTNISVFYIVISKIINPHTVHIPSGENNLLVYYLSITDEYKALNLFDNVPHSVTLTTDLMYQGYSYTHTNTWVPLVWSINILYGSISLYLDFNEITIDDINNTESKLREYYWFKKEIRESCLITIPSEILNSKCGLGFCPVSIFIVKNSLSSARYLFIPKSGVDTPMVLRPGVLMREEVLVKEIKYYLIEVLNDNIDGNVIVKFSNGFGEIYMNVLDESDDPHDIRKEKYPTEGNFKYKGDDNFHGKIIIIPNTVEKCNPCRYLLGVFGNSWGYTDITIHYSIIYSSQSQELNQNVPYSGVIKGGETNYFTFDFDEYTESIYIALYCADGDADMYMNYGKAFPTFNKYTWKSTNPQMDFITIDKSDPFFVTNGHASLEGTYTLLIYGYTNSTYTIFVSNHPKRIIPIANNQPAVCQCKSKDDKCYFRFDNLVPNYYKELRDISIVFATNYLYGSGIEYVKLYKENHYDIMDDFPDENNYDYSNKDVNKRNFIKIDIKKDNPKWSKESMLLVTVQCLEKSQFEINAAKIGKQTNQYLEKNRENWWYLSKAESVNTQPDVFYNKDAELLSFFNQENKNLNFEFYSYTGSGSVLAFYNTTEYDEGTHEYKSTYNHIASFKFSPNEPYFNFLKNSELSLYKNIHFKILPWTNLGFYVKLTYESEWTRVQIGKTMTYQVNNNVFNGYLDILDEYKDTILSVMCEDQRLQAKVYAKVNLYFRDINSGNKINPFDFKYPSSVQKDYDGTTNDITNIVSLKINEIPPDTRGDKYVRLLFSVHLGKKAKISSISNTNSWDEFDQSITILITPNINSYKRIETKPLKIYYSNERVIKSEKTIFDLQKWNKNDDVFVVEVSPCKGQFDMKLTNKLTYIDQSSTTLAKPIKKTKWGRTIITSFNMNETNYYLSVWGVLSPFVNCFDPDNEKCNVEYLIYYYTTTQKEYKRTSVKPFLNAVDIGSGKLEILINQLTQKDILGNVQSWTDFDIHFFISTNKTEFSAMDSLCYLSKMEKSNEVNNIKYSIDKGKNKILISGLNPGVEYYINAILENHHTGEIVAFTPIAASSKRFTGNLILLIVIGIIAISGLGFGMYYYYKKYRVTSDILKYEVNDIRNMSSLPDTSTEMANMRSGQNEKNKYMTLTSDPSGI